MKLATFVCPNGEAAVGAVDTSRNVILDLTKAKPDPAFATMLALIEGGAPTLEKARLPCV